ncbi:hypothetical protein CCACVL1_25852 [Corchorus capsularis]|uniref:Uncharacterized protein n=1 Tax=Corchorus capsularis TaxID=210143 RepID=A0A1R3GGT6_COCAP|nr:hypothetical protein CCACVL1_25852 [Corchorus capsularis]
MAKVSRGGRKKQFWGGARIELKTSNLSLFDGLNPDLVSFSQDQVFNSIDLALASQTSTLPISELLRWVGSSFRWVLWGIRIEPVVNC